MRAVLVAFVGSIVLCNVAILALNGYFIRSSAFHEKWLAGEYGEILAIARYLDDRDVRDGDFAVSVTYDDPYRRGESPWPRRVLYLLLDRRPGLGRDEIAAEGQDGPRFVVTRAPASVRRIWHVRLPLGGGSGQADQSASFYELHEVTGEGLVKVNVPPAPGAPPKVPGL
jgi:hypothetical protein